MNLREPCLPRGWYPREKGAAEAFLKPFAAGDYPAQSRQSAPAAIAPHAGWYYSGIPAAMAAASLDRDAQTVVVIGGHLPSDRPILLAEEDGVKTPFGTMNIDRQLREEFKKQVSAEKPVNSDRYQDNTVEVLLPMVHYFFPRAELLWLRFPAEQYSLMAGKLLAESARKLGRHIAVLASTDLTHYGENYGYSPRGRGKPALEWVKNVNDAAFIAAVLDNSPSRVLKHAAEDFAACSAGAVLGAMGFAACCGTSPGGTNSAGTINARLLDYRTSADIGGADEIPDSFVGYAALSIHC